MHEQFVQNVVKGTIHLSEISLKWKTVEEIYNKSAVWRWCMKLINSVGKEQVGERCMKIIIILCPSSRDYLMEKTQFNHYLGACRLMTNNMRNGRICRNVCVTMLHDIGWKFRHVACLWKIYSTTSRGWRKRKQIFVQTFWNKLTRKRISWNFFHCCPTAFIPSRHLPIPRIES